MAVAGPAPPIRRTLQATSLLAVLAGYVLLLLVNRALSQRVRQDRQLAQAQAAATALEQLPAAAVATAPQLRHHLAERATPLQLLWLQSGVTTILPAGAAFGEFQASSSLIRSAQQQLAVSPGPLAFSHQGRTFLVSGLPLSLAGRPYRLQLLSDITQETQQERQLTLLLVAFAGVSALFTSALLRLVIHRGLLPLDAFSATLAGMSSSSLGTDRLPLADQPPELQPIAAAFNDLLDRLSEAWEHQRTFVNGVSHELRTPITLIAGYSRRLQRRASSLTPEQAEQLELVASEAEAMGRLVTDLLEIARDDAGRLQLHCCPLDPYQLLRELQLRLAPTCGDRLLLGPAPLLSGAVSGDPERLSQCLTNLVENAIKYSPPATPIELGLSQDGDELVWHVRDHGPGVPPAERQRIFDCFVRGASQAASAGHGIGLAVVNTLMERMGGRVLVADPAAGSGADFQLRLPAPRPGLRGGFKRWIKPG
jgi:two-component system OmpR family sensor kinase